MLKVLHIVLGLQVGGLEKFVLGLVDSYSSKVKSTILCLADPKPQDEISTSAQLIRWDKKEGLSYFLPVKISKLVKRGNYDLIHTHNPSPHFYGVIAGLLSGVPVVHTKHGRNYPDNFKKVLLNRFSSGLSRRIVAVSSDAADVCLQVEKVSPLKVQTILNGVDTQRFTPENSRRLHRELMLPSTVLLVGIVARLSPEKNHQLLLDACRILKLKNILFHLVVVGDGPLRHTLEQTVTRYNLESSVTFLGMRQDVPTLIREFDIFVLSSRTEGVSLTLLEAMSCCVPVVASNVGGNPEVVSDGVTGFIVPQRADSFAEKIEWLLVNDLCRKKMGRMGRERVLETFALQRASEQYLSLYNLVVGGL